MGGGGGGRQVPYTVSMQVGTRIRPAPNASTLGSILALPRVPRFIRINRRDADPARGGPGRTGPRHRGARDEGMRGWGRVSGDATRTGPARPGGGARMAARPSRGGAAAERASRHRRASRRRAPSFPALPARARPLTPLQPDAAPPLRHGGGQRRGACDSPAIPPVGHARDPGGVGRARRRPAPGPDELRQPGLGRDRPPRGGGGGGGASLGGLTTKTRVRGPALLHGALRALDPLPPALRVTP